MRIAKRALPAGLFLLVPQVVLAQADFEEYVEKIRKAGMTEDAEGSIRGTAALVSGASVFEVKPTSDGKSLQRSYSSAMCFRPGADDEKAKALREKINARQEIWITFFKRQADGDGSGFVSSAEGWALRQRVELGLLIPQVPTVRSVDELAALLYEDKAKLPEEIAAYSKLRASAVAQGLEALPAIPVHLLGAVEQGAAADEARARMEPRS